MGKYACMAMRDKVNKRMSDELKEILRIACCNDIEYFAENIAVEVYNRCKEVYLEDWLMFSMSYTTSPEQIRITRSDRWLKTMKVGRKRVYPEEQQSE